MKNMSNACDLVLINAGTIHLGCQKSIMGRCTCGTCCRLPPVGVEVDLLVASLPVVHDVGTHCCGVFCGVFSYEESFY